MTNNVEMLPEIMLHSDLLCSDIERALSRKLPVRDATEVRLKISQCRAILSQLQTIYELNELCISNPTVRGYMRYLVMALMWVAYHARDSIDYKTFRRLVMVESTFSLLLHNELSGTGR